MGASGDEKLLADLQPMYLTVHLKFFFAFDQHHQFIGFMDEVSPHSPWRVDPQIAGKAARAPFFLNSFLIDGRHGRYSCDPCKRRQGAHRKVIEAGDRYALWEESEGRLAAEISPGTPFPNDALHDGLSL
jgi:hypothetical protein